MRCSEQTTSDVLFSSTQHVEKKPHSEHHTVSRKRYSSKSDFCSSLFFVEINECLNFGTCSHYCTNTKGSYKCTCDKNYKDMNGSCIAKGKDLYFLSTWPLASLWDFVLDLKVLVNLFIHYLCKQGLDIHIKPFKTWSVIMWYIFIYECFNNSIV